MTLSIIVPVLNEAAHLPTLFSTLSRQAGVAFELILVDGGSADASLKVADRLANEAAFPCRLFSSQRGRGRQLNEGVLHSSGTSLLFLHADSQFLEPHALMNAVNYLDARILKEGHERLAGRFSIFFQRDGESNALGFYFLECKARLDRSGCIHGDQGFLLKRNFFDEIGPFDETLGFLEDNRLAQAVRQKGRWLLFADLLLTSNRRFQQEGFRQRQELNALIMNLEAVGRDEILMLLPGLYRQQDATSKLRLQPFYQALGNFLADRPWSERTAFWYHTGRYLVANSWQLPFYGDVRRAFRVDLKPGTGDTPLLKIFDRFLGPIIDHPLGYSCAALLAWIWFRVLLVGR